MFTRNHLLIGISYALLGAFAAVVANHTPAPKDAQVSYVASELPSDAFERGVIASIRRDGHLCDVLTGTPTLAGGLGAGLLVRCKANAYPSPVTYWISQAGGTDANVWTHVVRMD